MAETTPGDRARIWQMEFSEFNDAIRDAILEAEYSRIPDLIIDWISENIHDIPLQNEALGHAADCRSILKKERQKRLTAEQAGVAIADWRYRFLPFLGTLKKYCEDQSKRSASESEHPALIQKVREALEDLNYKKEIRLFLQFQAKSIDRSGAFLINGAQYYGQNWLYQLLLTLLNRNTGGREVREVSLDFSGSIPLDMFLMELQDMFGLTGTGSEASDWQQLIDLVLNIWEVDQTLVFRLEMNGKIPPASLETFLSKFWIPLFRASQQRKSENYLLLFLIFGQPFQCPDEQESREIRFSAALTDQWSPRHPLLMDINLLNFQEVVGWLDSRMLTFTDLQDPEEVARDLMKQQDEIYPEIVMMGFCRRYKLSFRNHILIKQ